jgi:hypothetical protein
MGGTSVVRGGQHACRQHSNRLVPRSSPMSATMKTTLNEMHSRPRLRRETESQLAAPSGIQANRIHTTRFTAVTAMYAKSMILRLPWTPNLFSTCVQRPSPNTGREA